MPCESLPQARQFDFWLGRWRVEDAGGAIDHEQPPAVSRGFDAVGVELPGDEPEVTTWGEGGVAAGGSAPVVEVYGEELGQERVGDIGGAAGDDDVVEERSGQGNLGDGGAIAGERCWGIAPTGSSTDGSVGRSKLSSMRSGPKLDESESIGTSSRVVGASPSPLSSRSEKSPSPATDESDGSVVRYHPWAGVVLNLGLDHKSPAEVLDMFQTFNIPFFSWIMTECRKAVPVSHGISDAFSTGSQAQ